MLCAFCNNERKKVPDWGRPTTWNLCVLHIIAWLAEAGFALLIFSLLLLVMGSAKMSGEKASHGNLSVTTGKCFSTSFQLLKSHQMLLAFLPCCPCVQSLTIVHMSILPLYEKMLSTYTAPSLAHSFGCQATAGVGKAVRRLGRV